MILDRFRLDDQVAVITGAGRGLGAATAVGFAEAGADVVISARTANQLTEVADAVRSRGREAYVVPADLGSPDTAASLAAAAEDRFGRLDIVVNNVGGAMPKPLADTSVAELEEAFRFNVSTAHALIDAAAPRMLANTDGGSVINITSAMGRLSSRGFAAYGTAKAALAHYTRLAAMDLCPRVRVNAIAPGSILTSSLEVVAADESLRSTMEASTPLRRLGTPEDVTSVALLLASPAGSYLTGKVLEPDGGLTAPNFDMGLPDL